MISTTFGRESGARTSADQPTATAISASRTLPIAVDPTATRHTPGHLPDTATSDSSDANRAGIEKHADEAKDSAIPAEPPTGTSDRHDDLPPCSCAMGCANRTMAHSAARRSNMMLRTTLG